ncbi:MAG: sarcosine oxidase subunit gamma family protein [Pseudomonadota bacterium]
MSERSFDGLVKVRELPQRGMMTLKGDLASAAVKEAAVLVTGVDFPAMGQCNCDGEHGLAWMAPDELLVLCPHKAVIEELGRMDTVLAASHHLIADVSDARVIFRIEGAGLRDVLAKLCPADLRPASLAPGQFRRTRLAQVPCAFWLRGDDWAEIVVFRSVADYAWDVLCQAASPDAAVGHLSA